MFWIFRFLVGAVYGERVGGTMVAYSGKLQSSDEPRSVSLRARGAEVMLLNPQELAWCRDWRRRVAVDDRETMRRLTLGEMACRCRSESDGVPLGGMRSNRLEHVDRDPDTSANARLREEPYEEDDDEEEEDNGKEKEKDVEDDEEDGGYSVFRGSMSGGCEILNNVRRYSAWGGICHLPS